MKAIKWATSESTSIAVVGGVILSIYSHVTKSHKTKWVAVVHCPLTRNCAQKYGPYRDVLDRAQEDAIQLARELLLDIQTCLNTELKNFGLEPVDEE